MSPDWASASRFTRSLTALASTVTPSRPADRTPKRSLCRYPVTTSELAMKVFDGTQSESTHAPPAPSASTRVTSASSCAATSAASYPPGPPPMITIRLTILRPPLRYFVCFMPPMCRHAHLVFSTTGRPGYRHRRGSLRRVRLKPGSSPDAGLLPALPHDRGRVGGGLAPDLRRRGRHGLGGRGHHDRGIPRRPGLRLALRRAPVGRGAARRGRGRDGGRVPEAHRARLHARGRVQRLGLRLRRLRGRHADRLVSLRDRQRGREGRRAGRLRGRSAPAADPDGLARDLTLRPCADRCRPRRADASRPPGRAARPASDSPDRHPGRPWCSRWPHRPRRPRATRPHPHPADGTAAAPPTPAPTPRRRRCPPLTDQKTATRPPTDRRLPRRTTRPTRCSVRLPAACATSRSRWRDGRCRGTP